MNLKWTLGLAALSLAMQANAQTAQKQTRTQQLFNQKTKPAAATTLAQKSTATASRIVAVAMRLYNEDSVSFLLMDTSHISYTGSRGGDLNSEWIKFDTGVNYTNNGSGLEYGYTFSQSFDGNDNIISSIQKEWDGTAFVNSYATANTFDGNNNMLTSTEMDWNLGTSTWDSSYKYTYTYDGNNNVLTELNQSWNGTTLEDDYRATNTYNTNNMLTLSVDEVWNGTAWENNSRTTITYDMNNVMLTSLRETWNGTAWENSYLQTNTVTGGNIVSSLDQYWNGSWQNMNNTLYTYDGNGNNLTEIAQSWSGSFVNQRKVTRTYNTYNQVLTEQDSTWDGTAWGNIDYDSWGSYYYETYNTASVGNTSAAVTDLKVYPVPAGNLLNVSFANDEATDVTVSVIDMNGRQLKSFSEKGARHFKRTIDTHSFPAGTYFVKINANGKVSYQQFSVVR